MYPEPIERLIQLFSKLPGVGPRQATRMAFYVLSESNGYAASISRSIDEVRKNISFCDQCFRSVQKSAGKNVCAICQDPKRDQRIICVVEKEIDIANIEKTAAYHGTYHVLGGTISLLDKESPERLRLKDLYQRIETAANSGNALEMIIAMSPTSEGDSTALYLKRTLEPLIQKFPALKLTMLGRGLSLGAEVEYADQVTLESALKYRTPAG